MKKVEVVRSSATIELLELAEENPGLPIIVEGSSAAIAISDYGCLSWFGKVAGACIEHIWTGRTPSGMCRAWTLNEALIENHSFIEENAPASLKEKLEKLSDVNYEKSANEWIKSLAWEKCIIAYVGISDSAFPEPEI